jgi:acetyl-CoA C-acetyltransferase
MKRVGVIGVGWIKIDSYPDRPEHEILTEALKMAIDDCGVTKRDIDGMIIVDRVYNEQQMFENWYPSAYLKLETKVCAKVLSGGASPGLALSHARYALMTGDACLMVVAAVNRETHVTTADHMMFAGRTFDRDYEIIHGVTITGVNGAMLTQRYMYEHKVPHEHIAMVAVRNRENASLNPIARYRQPLLTVEDVFASRVIAHPIHLLECASRDDGAAVVILANEDRAKEFRKPPIWIKGYGEYHDAASYISDDLTQLPALGRAVQIACERAKVGPRDIQFAEFYTPFAVMEVIALDEMGFFPRGKGARMIYEGYTHRNGKFPMQVSGGLTSRGHPTYATELYNFVGVVQQLRGEAGDIQLPGVTIGVATGAHSGANGHTVNILARED